MTPRMPSTPARSHAVFFGAIALLVIVLVGFILRQEYIVRAGEVTILKTRPVDPRDLLRGEYVVLAYEIQSDDRIRSFVTDHALKTGDAVYVGLTEDAAGVATIDTVEVYERDVPSNADLWLMGTVESDRVRFSDIEQYFVPEGAGLPIERMRGDINVEVSIRDGEARIIQLLDAEYQPLDPAAMVEDRADTEWW